LGRDPAGNLLQQGGFPGSRLADNGQPPALTLGTLALLQYLLQKFCVLELLRHLYFCWFRVLWQSLFLTFLIQRRSLFWGDVLSAARYFFPL